MLSPQHKQLPPDPDPIDFVNQARILDHSLLATPVCVANHIESLLLQRTLEKGLFQGVHLKDE